MLVMNPENAAVREQVCCEPAGNGVHPSNDHVLRALCTNVEHALIAFDFRGGAHRLVWIIGQFHGGAPICLDGFANQ